MTIEELINYNFGIEELNVIEDALEMILDIDKNITVKNCRFDHGGVVAELNHLDGFTFTGNSSPDTMQILSAHSRNIRTDCSTVIERD